MFFKIATLGCKVNQCESQWIREVFLANGWVEAEEESSDVDLAIVNTCSVTAESDAKSRKVVAHLGKTCPGAEIVVVGCYAASRPEEAQGLPRVSETVPDKRLLVDFFKRRGLVNIPTGVRGLADRKRAYVKVQDGCRVGCAYCVIPKTRPYLQSRPIADIVAQANDLAANGYREIVLVGIHLGHYGLDFCPALPNEPAEKRVLTLDDYLARRDALPEEKRVGLANLLDALTRPKIPNMRFRLGSLEAVEVSNAILDLFAERPEALCPHFHLSMQSGDDLVLARMGRRWSSAPYIAKCEEIRSRIPDAALSTDVIVGFPGETSANFERTCQVVRKLNFSRTHVFRFSARPGTVAATLPNPVPEQVKKERARILIEIAREEREKFARRFLGREARIVVEEIARDESGNYFARGTTDRYYEARVPLGARVAEVEPGDAIIARLESLDGDVFLAELAGRAGTTDCPRK